MRTATNETAVTSLPSGDRLDISLDDITHRFCLVCKDTRAICGYNTAGYEMVEADGTERDCPICESIVGNPCPWCGDDT